jgi:hypothetical protein
MACYQTPITDQQIYHIYLYKLASESVQKSGPDNGINAEGLIDRIQCLHVQNKHKFGGNYVVSVYIKWKKKSFFQDFR